MSYDAIGDLLSMVSQQHGSDPVWSEVLMNATKAIMGIRNQRAKVAASISATLGFQGPLGDKWACEQYALEWQRLSHGKNGKPWNLPSRCFFCGFFMSGKIESRDHLWPKSRGGTNTVSCCKSCNGYKGAMLPEVFRMAKFGDATEFFAEYAMRINSEGIQFSNFTLTYAERFRKKVWPKEEVSSGE